MDRARVLPGWQSGAEQDGFEHKHQPSPFDLGITGDPETTWRDIEPWTRQRETEREAGA